MTDAPTPRDERGRFTLTKAHWDERAARMREWLRPELVAAMDRAALTRREPLDVERLARAMHIVTDAGTDLGCDDPDISAPLLAAEYARLEAAATPAEEGEGRT